MFSKRKKAARKAKEKASLEIWLSAHIRNVFCIGISNLDQKAAKCTTCKRFCGNFPLFIAVQWPENGSTSFKTWFSTKFPGGKGLIDWDRDFCSHVASHTYCLNLGYKRTKRRFQGYWASLSRHHVLISSDHYKPARKCYHCSQWRCLSSRTIIERVFLAGKPPLAQLYMFHAFQCFLHETAACTCFPKLETKVAL